MGIRKRLSFSCAQVRSLDYQQMQQFLRKSAYSGRNLYSILTNRCRVSRELARRLVKWSKKLIYLQECLIRKKTSNELLRRVNSGFSIPRNGYLILEPEVLPSMNSTVKICQTIFERYRQSSVSQERGDSKSFRPNILKPEDLLDFPEILSFATSDEILATTSRYLGTLPIIGDIRLWSSTET